MLNSLCGATLSATREFAGLVRVLNSLVVVAMITTRELLAPYGLGFYFAGEFFACLFCGNQSIACTQFPPDLQGQAGFFAKTADAVLAEKGKSKIEADSKESAKGKGNYCGVLATRKPT